MDLPQTITFENTKQDLLCGYRHVNSRSPVKKIMRAIMILFLAFLAIQSAPGALAEHSEAGIGFVVFNTVLTFLVLWGLITLLSWLLRELFFRRLVTNARHNDGVLGTHEMTIAEDHVIERTSVNETRFLWRSVPRVEGDKDYIFLYQTHQGAHVIPRRIFATQQEAQEFLELLRDLRERGHNQVAPRYLSKARLRKDSEHHVPTR